MNTGGKTQGDELAELARGCTLKNVRPIRFSARLVRDAPPPSSTVHLSVRPQVGFTRDGKDGFSVRAAFAFHARGPDNAIFFRAAYDVVASYLADRDDFSDAALERFSQTNAMIHLWPYFRAFVQSACGQLGIPPMTVPVFRVTSGG